jgi:broad specificity phosphatase PhoE
MVTMLYLVRHPPTTAAPGHCYGRTDLPLSEGGRRAALELAESFAALRVDAIYASPLQRARDTAEPIGRATGHEVTTLDDLAEIDFGAFESRAFDDIASENPGVYEEWMSSPSAVQFPRGESYVDLKRRAGGALGEIRGRHPGQRVAVVSHVGPIRAILADALGLKDELVFRFDVVEGSVAVVEWRAGVACLRALNLRPQGGLT